MERGFIQLYTGNGKGKTCAAFGMALRAAMTGRKVFIGQFVKSMKYSETRIEDLLENITIRQFGQGCRLTGEFDPQDRQLALEGLRECARALRGGYGLVILDEVTIALHFGLFSVDELLAVLREKAEGTEVILTGRYAPQALIEQADLVTDMREIKHYYAQGVLSRKGFDC